MTRDAKSRGELIDKIRKVKRIQNRDEEKFIHSRFPYGLDRGMIQDVSQNQEPTNSSNHHHSSSHTAPRKFKVVEERKSSQDIQKAHLEYEYKNNKNRDNPYAEKPHEYHDYEPK
jgi:hypothetical protein